MRPGPGAREARWSIEDRVTSRAMDMLSVFQSRLDTIAQGNLKLIKLIPEDKLTWRPHERSMSLGRLGQHLAELPHWMNRIVEADHYDFVLQGFKVPEPPASVQEIILLYHAKYEAAKAALAKAIGIDMALVWEMRRSGVAFTTYPRAIGIATQLDHMVHHRGQLTVYLRLLEVAIPGLFGPSADERLGPLAKG